MFVISIAPLKRGVSADVLSYFSSIAYKEGTLVRAPVRQTTVLGLVTKSEEVSTAKTALRAATFSLKRLPPQSDMVSIGEAYVNTAKELGFHYASSLGTILYNLLPPEIRDGDIPLPHTHHVAHAEKHPPHIMQAQKKDRYVQYRSLVRETFAHAGSVLLVVPASISAEEIKDELGVGIADRVIVLTSTMTKSELKKAYTHLDDFSKTKLIIATPSHALIERHDITLVIVEQSRSSYYKELNRPYLDYRDVLTIHAKHTGRKIILADILPRAEEEKKRRDDIYMTQGETPKRIAFASKLEIIDTTKPTQDIQTAFTLFSTAVISAIKDVRKRKGTVFLFTARRGLAPLIYCADCAYIFRSKASGAPYSLIRTKHNETEERWFVCGVSGEKVRASDTCPSCGSWRLRERGIGIQQVYDELDRHLPNAPIILFDHLTARTYKKALFLRDTFYKTRGAILLGTHMAVPYLTKPIQLSVVVNMDALLATPTWRLEEENLSLLLALRERSTERLMIQTRTPNAEVLSHAKSGTVEQFYSEELALRKTYHYPPYVTFIHFTWQGLSEETKKIEDEMHKILAEYPLTTYPHPAPSSTEPIMYGLLRIPSTAWPDTKLRGLIRQIHPSVRIVVNPDRIV